ncbi:MAG: class I SAM-dependent methyltransferase [Bacteroidetes bacterium]|jgi:extracellular factor (EF) 3-hydroxypalmitic acid methyl ester biosynthesis protein|nr:class I SAM-dependent methyltransferase [Bacteroidota bacterium]MBT6686052.1 class I SAM-dependent methyltransferase [Bacteroidota bacterium]MBT7142728.1 class I SAM-dependent methyltransferase [Bacteroidota bacterium]MBT7491331.1 class I SAM-dependent methyltransferase [Bacteroidota bacterium]
MDYNKEFVSQLVLNGGPEKHEYSQLNNILNSIGKEEIESFREQIKPSLNIDTMHGFGFNKPFGYSGDFFMIEKIYSYWINQGENCKKWDLFFHNHSATQAVRNRKEFFIKVLEDIENNENITDKAVLILGSGPATDVAEFFDRNPQSKMYFDLLDLDPKAIDYAKIKNIKYQSQLNFLNRNVLRLKPEKKYCLIWSAGLFDYFGDRHFTFLIKKYFEFVRKDCELIVGNFSQNNPSKNYMEIMGDWFLNYRSEEELIKIAENANVPNKQINLESEPLGINLFMRIKKR